MLAVTTIEPVHGPMLLNGEPAGAEPDDPLLAGDIVPHTADGTVVGGGSPLPLADGTVVGGGSPLPLAVLPIAGLPVEADDDPSLTNASMKPAPCTELSDVSRRNTLPDVTTIGEGGVEPLSVATSAPDALVPE